jgi:germacradienol/geosmin synthase
VDGLSATPGDPSGLAFELVGGLSVSAGGSGGLDDPSGLAFELLGSFGGLDEPQVNRYLDRARRDAGVWVRETGLVPGVWDERVYESMELPLLAALTKPEAADEQLRLLTLWDIWTFALDDHFAKAYKRGGDLAGAKAFVAGLARFMPIGGDDAPPPGNPVERALADIWPRTKGGLCAEGVTAFPVHVMEFAEANLWELDNLIRRHVPDPVDYLQMRRKTSRGVLSAQLALVAERQALPPDVLESPELRALSDAFADDVGFRNDVFSYRKEIEAEGEIATGLLVIQGFLGCDLRRAVEIAGDLVIDRQARFRRIAEEDLPMMCDEHDLDADERGLVDAYVGGLRQWLAGEPAWYGRTSRYTDLEGIK